MKVGDIQGQDLQKIILIYTRTRARAHTHIPWILKFVMAATIGCGISHKYA